LQILLKFLANTSALALENLKEVRDVFVKFFEEFCIQVFDRTLPESEGKAFQPLISTLCLLKLQ